MIDLLIDKLNKLPRYDLEYNDKDRSYYAKREMIENTWDSGEWVQWDDIAKIIKELR